MASNGLTEFYDGTMHMGYNNQDWTLSYDPNDTYFVRPDPIGRKLGTLTEECVLAATQIRQAYPGMPIYVFNSGGIDSEAILESFVRAKVPVTSVTLRYEDNLNEHEVKYVYEYVKKRERFVSLKVIDFKMTDWLQSNEAMNYARMGQTIQLGHTHIFKVANDMLHDGLVITGTDQPKIIRDDSNGGAPRFLIDFEEKHCSALKFFKATGIRSVPVFYQWSSALMTSYMLASGHTGFYNNLYNPNYWLNEFFKYHFLYKAFKLQPRKKYTSYERLSGVLMNANRRYRETLPLTWERHCEIDVFDWFKTVGVMQ